MLRDKLRSLLLALQDVEFFRMTMQDKSPHFCIRPHADLYLLHCAIFASSLIWSAYRGRFLCGGLEAIGDAVAEGRLDWFCEGEAEGL